MGLFTSRQKCLAALPLLSLGLLFAWFSSAVSAANIGTIVPVVGQVADLTFDARRNLVYLAVPYRNEVQVYSVGSGRLEGSILGGSLPGSLALSPDGNRLYIANLGSLTISAVNLDTRQIELEYSVGSRPDSIAVGNDGNIIILGTAGLLRLEPATGKLISILISPPATPPAGLPITPTSPTPAGFLAGLVSAASGNLIIGLSTSRLFVYDVASQTVLRSRNVTGLRAILSASPDGSRFMAGPFLFDTQTLTILGRAGSVAASLTGGSVFSVDGNSVFATFSTQVSVQPLNTNSPDNPGGAVIPGAIAGQISGPPTRAVLQRLRSSSLTQEIGLRLPETIISKVITSSDGENLFANSASGILAIPVGQLSKIPVLDVSATNVVLSVDMCNRRVATTAVKLRNTGGGKMTVAATPNIQNAPIVLSLQPGPQTSTLNISFDPRNVTNFNTLQYVVMLVSPEAVNIEPAILVNLNFRDVGQRGAMVPLNGVGVDLQVDSKRRLLYIANYTQDQVEVFSMVSQTFIKSIRVGNRPRAIALTGPSTLVVANSGAENVSVVDLNTLQEVERIPMGPIPLNATPLFPRSIAASSNAILFSAVPLSAAGVAPGTGSLWQLSLLTHTAYPRLDLGAGNRNVIQGRNLLVAPENGNAIMLVEGNGTLRLYEPISDTFPVTASGAVPGLRGTAAAAADGSFFVVDNLLYNNSMQLQGTLVPGNAGAAFGVASAGKTVVRVQAPTNLIPVQSLQSYGPNLQMAIQVALPEPVMDINPAAIGTATGTRQWPPRVTALELGVANQVQLLPRGMAVDATSNTAYVMTYSGLSSVSLRPTAGQVPSFLATGVVNGASHAGPVSPGSLISILGANMADAESAGTAPLPRLLGGVCVTANEITIPLLNTSPAQIDAQLPPEIQAGSLITLNVRSTRLGVVSAGTQVQVLAASPGVFALDLGGQQRAALFHADSMLVVPAYPGDPNEQLNLYVTGLGPVNPLVPAGLAGAEDPASLTTLPIGVSIGGTPYTVIRSQLMPGYVGVFQVTIRVPANRARGDNLPVVVTAGGISSVATNAPLAAIR